VDWVDQAILTSVLGADEATRQAQATPTAPAQDDPVMLHVFRRFGIRSATDLYDIIADPPADWVGWLFPNMLKEEQQARIRTLNAILTNHPNFTLVRNWRMRTGPRGADGTG
jgi:hypothetical protein